MSRKWTFVLVALVVAVAAVAGRAWTQRASRETSVATATKTATSSKADGVATAIELAAGDVARVATVDFARTLDVSGSIKAANSAVVKARVAGELRSLSVREGDAVRAGQVIGQIDSTEYDLRWRQAQQQSQASRAQLDIAQRALKYNQALVDQGFISSTALETSVANAAAARANVNAAEAAVSLAGKARSDATLVAPIAGLVSQRMAQPGERVGVDARIVEVVDLKRMELEAAVPPADAAELRVGQRSTVKVEGIETALVASVARISPTAQAGSRAVLTYFTVEPHPALRQGLFARGTVAIEQRRALAVPSSAIRNDQTQPTVPTIVEAAVVNKVVVLGARGHAGGESLIELKSGLSDGDIYLTGSVGVVRNGTIVRMPPANRADAAGAGGVAAASAVAR